ncbi:MAG: phenylalanine--tRNA ligase subunit alpha [Candidatus Thorarchaeota archaeon]|nr:phenylalanine--tRNA ligase subunit alpha [Candidatus Thorarchaeota archaeon]
MTEQTQLTEGERKVLTSLLKHSSTVSAREMASELGDREDRITSILHALAEKGIVMLESREMISYSLTEEGRLYDSEGLPEIRLFRAVKGSGGTALMEQAVAAAGLDNKTKGVAMNWATKLKAIAVKREGSSTLITAQADEIKSELPEVLRAIATGDIAAVERLREGMNQAVERKLVSQIVTRAFYACVPQEKKAWAENTLRSVEEALTDLTPELLASGGWRGRTFKPYNVTLRPPFVSYGKKHPYAEFNDWLKEILVGLGFTEWYGPYVETEFWNNDTLFVPQDHVAREVQDQFRVTQPHSHGVIVDEKYYRAVKAVHENGADTGSTGWQSAFSRDIATRLCLRSHTTPVSMRYLWEHRDSPQKMFIVDRNFRAEALSARHAQEFDQCEGIIMDKGLTLRDLMGYIREICTRVGIKKMKFKPGQFPFTEPSIECYAKHETLGWIEVAPGGIFRPEVTHPLGIRDSVLAWGIGSGRLYMASMGISDIRELHTRDLSWLRRSQFVRC